MYTYTYTPPSLAITATRYMKESGDNVIELKRLKSYTVEWRGVLTMPGYVLT